MNKHQSTPSSSLLAQKLGFGLGGERKQILYMSRSINHLQIMLGFIISKIIIHSSLGSNSLFKLVVVYAKPSASIVVGLAEEWGLRRRNSSLIIFIFWDLSRWGLRKRSVRDLSFWLKLIWGNGMEGVPSIFILFFFMDETVHAACFQHSSVEKSRTGQNLNRLKTTLFCLVFLTSTKHCGCFGQNKTRLIILLRTHNADIKF